MKIPGLIMLMALMKISSCEEQHALFFHTGSIDPVENYSSDYDLDDAESRRIRQTELTVRSVLEWLQGRYSQPSKKSARSFQSQASSASEPSREYLPVPEQQKERPRPFQPATPAVPSQPTSPPGGSYIPPNSNYPQPPSQNRPTPPPAPPVTAYPTPSPQLPEVSYLPPGSNYPQRPPQTQPPPPPITGTPQLPGGSYIPPVTNYPQRPSPVPTSPPQSSGGSSTAYPFPQTSQPAFPSNNNFPPVSSTPQPGYYPSSPQPSQPTYYPQTTLGTGKPGYPYEQTPQPPFPQPGSELPKPPSTLLPPGEVPYPDQQQTQRPVFPNETPQPEITGEDQDQIGGGPNEIPAERPVVPEGDNHPPHIHDISVQCAKDEMTINIEFNRAFNGVIYSKGFYKDNSCRYVNQDSGQTKYSFTVRLNACGTQFVDQFQEGGQAYLENVLVLQNEPGIQEVWDTIRRVRCLWEGNIKESLSVSLNIGMLSQETVTFSGDTAIAHLDIQAGRGPFAPAANGLVKIGETMTLVVSVEGDPGFDIHVRDCVAKDVTETNLVQLTDEQGCVLKPKLMGAFQKTRETGNSGASIIAYAFFQAFKFPDVMDLTIECNVELCKTECDMCPNLGQSIDPVARRRRRDLWLKNSTLGDPVRVYRSFRVITPDDLDDAISAATIVNVGSEAEGICMSTPGFFLAAVLLLSILLSSCLLTAYLWLKIQRVQKSSVKTIHLDAFPASKA